MHLHAGNLPGPGTSTVLILRTLPSDQIDPLKQRARSLVTRRCQSQVRALHHPVWRISPKRSKSPALQRSALLLDGATYFNCLTLLRSRPHTGLAITHYARAGSWSWSKGGPLTPPCFPNPRPRPRASMAALSIWWCRSWRPFGFFGFARNNWPLCVCLCLYS